LLLSIQFNKPKTTSNI